MHRPSLFPFSALLALAACSSSSATPAPSPGQDGGTGADSAGAEAGVAPSGCISDVSAGDHTFACDGLSVDISIPDACAAGGCGLVLDVHGALESGPIEEAHMAIRPIARQRGYVVVQPSANVVAAIGGPSWTPGTDDDKILAALDAVEAALRTDRARTHVTGFSQGGYMTWRLLCKHADRFASVAPGAAGQAVCGAQGFFESCAFGATSSPSRQVDVLFLLGRKDGVVPYSCMSAQRDALVAAWALGSGAVVAQDGSYAHTRWTNAQGTVFETLEHDYTTDPKGVLASNKGHCYPGSQAHLGNAYDQLACTGTQAFAWGAAVMDFFQATEKKK